jgi:2-polyprenyl-3-methyl-5-hydroxy-6-metoxy-1,4-benzoquinol methylase
MFKKIIKKLLPFIGNSRPDVDDIDQKGWDSRYNSGEWSYLGNLSELAHYSVIVGYCRFFAPKGCLLDVGCGEGLLQQRLSVLPYKYFTGIDISPVAVNNANEKYKDERTIFFAADATSYKDESLYDVIIFNESLYCFQDSIEVLNHYKQLLTEDGVFVISMHVQEVSLYQWGEIEKHFDILDAVKITNAEDISWKCKVVKPR